MPFSCDNLFCLYNDEERCILRYPRLDFTGQCKSKVYPKFDTEYINKVKEEFIKNLDAEKRV